VSTTRPASLDGSLLARKGDATPAIANDSPLLEELGEPRPDQIVDPSGTTRPVEDSSGGVLGLIGHGLSMLARHPVYGVLSLAIGIAILFAVTIVALTPSPDLVSAPAVPTPAASADSPDETKIPTDAKSMTEPPEEVGESATILPETVTSPPDSPVQVTPAEPPARMSPPEPPAPRVVAKPPARPAVAASPSARSGGYLLQLSAVPTAKAARRELLRLQNRLGRLLGDRKIVVVKAVPPGKPPVYRLRASAYDTHAAARAACKQIQRRKIACWVVPR
jgi:hypothetical protein